MSLITVKHVRSKEGWEKPKDGSASWIDYWEKNSSFKLGSQCRDCRCSITASNPFVGAHVKKAGNSDMSIYIVPTCKTCNTRGASDFHEFKCDERILIPANVNNL